MKISVAAIETPAAAFVIVGASQVWCRNWDSMVAMWFNHPVGKQTDQKSFYNSIRKDATGEYSKQGWVNGK